MWLTHPEHGETVAEHPAYVTQLKSQGYKPVRPVEAVKPREDEEAFSEEVLPFTDYQSFYETD